MTMNVVMLVVAGVVAGVMLTVVAVEFAAVYFIRREKHNGE